jgi:hypothetical protein
VKGTVATVDTISKKILERIETRLEDSGIEYGIDIEPCTTKFLGRKVHGHEGSVYTLTKDLTVDRRVTFIRLLDTLRFEDAEGVELASCKPGESFPVCHRAYANAPVLIDLVVQYLSTDDPVQRLPEHDWTDDDDVFKTRCRRCHISKSEAAAMDELQARRDT